MRNELYNLMESMNRLSEGCDCNGGGNDCKCGGKCKNCSCKKVDENIDMAEDYNGWSDRETWNVALWLSNDEGLYRHVVSLARTSLDAEDLAKDLESFAATAFPEGVTPDGDSIQGVDWLEIAQGFEEDADWDSDDEEDDEFEEAAPMPTDKQKATTQRIKDRMKKGDHMKNESKLNEANIRVDIEGLESTDAETLSQMLHLAGMAQTPQDAMMGGDPFTPVGGDDMDIDGMGTPEPVTVPIDGASLGTGDMGALDMEPEPEMGMEPELPADDIEGNFDVEMGADAEPEIEIEPMDKDDMDIMSPEDDEMVMQDDISDLLKLSGMEKLPENDDPLKWANEPDEMSSGDAMDMPSGGPNRKHSRGHGARSGDNPMAVKERAAKIRQRLERM